MGTEAGKQVGLAIQAVLRMQADCVRLFRDLDRALNELLPISGGTVTAGAGYTINAPQLYLPKLLFRRYARPGAEHLVLGVNVWLHNHPERSSDEPIFIAGNVQYAPEAPDSGEESLRAWDTLAAFWDWNSERAFGRALTVAPKRGTIVKVVVAAEPLYSINSLGAALRVIDMVGRP
ncbi:MAG: hypothetical protein ABSC62_01160 [Terracidiphilus sp.]|jgi:hypothetical protein